MAFKRQLRGIWVIRLGGKVLLMASIRGIMKRCMVEDENIKNIVNKLIKVKNNIDKHGGY